MASLLPHEIVRAILQHTDLRALFIAARVCRVWRDAAASTRDGWRLLLERPVQSSCMLRFPCALALCAGHILAAEERRLHLIDVGQPSRPFEPVDHLICSSCVLARPLPLSRGATGPSGLAVDDGAILVTDGGLDKLYKYRIDPNQSLLGLGRPVCEAGGFGAAEGLLISPGDIALSGDELGFIFVAEGHGVTAFRTAERDGAIAFSHKWGRHGRAHGEFRQVGGLASCGGDLFACDVRNHRIQCFVGASGKFQYAFGGKGEKPGEFRRPSAIASVRGCLVVAEMTGRRLQVLSLLGSPLQIISVRHVHTARPASLACFCVDAERG
eukprot:CAMPEP_0119401860 /NCGR_PEP_ID=MMETSP1334-20130426/142586_1 /TAXON_ID=127549 /ORGANISM="Calcidiscus leptoporus, Strain RCC1130" /LENGTH=325 /DNA_ID=CAMNT_0007425783 /DNA_START=380 /DNA_END=1353 /DNA_ORIENTATION=-